MEYKNISSKFTLQSTGTKKDRMQRAMSKKVSYNKYIRFHISTMKGIVKDCFSLQYERLMKKNFTLHLRSYIPIPQYWPGVPCIYDILATFKLSCNTYKISSIYLRSYHFTLWHYFWYAYTPYIYSKYLKKESLKAIQHFFVIFFFVSTLNSMGGVLCSATVSE